MNSQEKLEQYTQQALAKYTTEAYQRGRIDERASQGPDLWWAWWMLGCAVGVLAAYFSGLC